MALTDTEFRFAFTPAFLLFIPVAFMLIWWLLGQLRGTTPVMQYSDTRVLGGLPISMRLRLRRIPDFLRLVALSLLIIALARPQLGVRDDTIRGEGIDIALAMDISNSMNEPDLNNLSRFDAAKQVLRDFIEGRTFDSIGLVVFGEQAFYQSPLTVDYSALVRVLDGVPLASELGLGNRTAIGMGLATAVNMLRERESVNERVVILLTDGVNNAGEIDPITAAQAANAYSIRVYTVGINTTDPAYPNSTAERTLRDVASITGGRYYNATTLDELRSIYDDIDQLEGREVALQIEINWTDQAYPLILATIILLLIERYLRTTIFQTIP